MNKERLCPGSLLILFTCSIVFHFFSFKAGACSVLYYKDPATGKIYVANHEDYWYDVKAYIRILPGSEKKKELARLWYGWDDFAQGGVNAAGLFFDGAVTPEQERPAGYGPPNGNLGDEILAFCSTAQEAVAYLEKKKVALTNAHMMFGDKIGNAVVVEWVDGQQKLHWISGNQLVMTNFLLSDTTKGNYPCYRYHSIEERIAQMERDTAGIDLLKVGNTIAQAAQSPRADDKGRKGGTLYSVFLNLTDMKFFLVYQLDNAKVTQLDLKEEFRLDKKKKIGLE